MNVRVLLHSEAKMVSILPLLSASLYALAIVVSAADVYITSPYEVVQWKAGKPAKITWKTLLSEQEAIAPGQRVNIDLMDGDHQNAQVIARVARNIPIENQAITWKVPDDFPSTKSAFVRVQSPDGKIIRYSHKFGISGPNPNPNPNPSESPSPYDRWANERAKAPRENTATQHKAETFSVYPMPTSTEGSHSSLEAQSYSKVTVSTISSSKSTDHSTSSTTTTTSTSSTDDDSSSTSTSLRVMTQNHSAPSQRSSLPYGEIMAFILMFLAFIAV